MGIISTTEFKTFKGISGSTYDALIGTLIASAQAEVERYTGRNFDADSGVNEYISGDGTNRLFTKNFPITSVAQISIVDDSGSESVLDSSAYRANLETGEIVLLPDRTGRISRDAYGIVDCQDWSSPSVWPEGFRNINVEYSYGYDDGLNPPPDDLKFAMYRYVDALFQQFKDGGSESLQFQSETLVDYTYNRGNAASIFETFRHLFNAFKRSPL